MRHLICWDTLFPPRGNGTDQPKNSTEVTDPAVVVMPPPSDSIPTIEEDEARLDPVRKHLIGDMKSLEKWLADKPLPLRAISWYFRAVGAPVFINNPIAGLLMLTAIFIHNPWVGLGGSLGLLVALVFGICLKQGGLENGGATFHGFLVGLVVMAMTDEKPYTAFIPIILLGALTIYVQSGLGKIFSTFNLPAFNLPFVFTIFLYLGATTSHNRMYALKIITPNSTDFHAQPDQEIIWTEVLKGIPFALGQIYASPSWISSIVLFVALFIGSPLVALHALLGSTVSVFTAMALGANPEQVYMGEWSFNGLLSCASVAGFFCIPSIHSHLLAIASAFLATIIYGNMATALAFVELPAVAFPFVISASICLCFSTKSPGFQRTPMGEITYPAQHWRRFGGHKRAAAGRGNQAANMVNVEPKA